MSLVVALGVIPLIGLTLGGCGSSSSSGSGGSSASASGSEPSSLTGVTWVLTSYVGPSGAPTPAVTSPDEATLTFAPDGVLAGSTGCNHFGGSYVQHGTALTTTTAAMTQKACTEPAATAQETAILAALAKVKSYAAGSSLTLLGADEATLLTYAAAPSGLAGTSWRATGINNGKGGVEASAETEKVTAMFTADGKLTGTGACNSYGTTYTTTGSNGLTVGEIAQTAMGCPDPAMKVDDEYFTALGKVVSYQREGSRLTLKDAGGATQVSYALGTS
jgi:heat shock protein HslJ